MIGRGHSLDKKWKKPADKMAQIRERIENLIAFYVNKTIDNKGPILAVPEERLRSGKSTLAS